MKNFITITEQQKVLESLTDKIKDAVLNEIEKPLDVKGAAKHLNKSIHWIYKKIAKLPHYKIDGSIFFFKSELNKWVRGEK